MRAAGILHNGGHVRKVQVDDDPLRVTDQLGNGGHGLLQHIISDAESVGKGDLLIGDILQTVIGNDNQGVDLGTQLSNTCLTHTVGTLKLEGLGHNAHSQNASLVSQVSHDGSSAGTGTAAHTGGDEHHIGALQNLGDSSAGFLGGLSADLRLGASAHTIGELLTDLDLILAGRLIQILLVRVNNDKINAAHAGLDHTINNIVAGAADTNYLNFYNAILKCFSHMLSSYVSFYRAKL